MVVDAKGQFSTKDDFVGTDFWVMARVRNKNKSYSYCYIKILSKEEVTNENGFTHSVYTILELDIRWLSRGDVYYCTQEDKDRKLNGSGAKVDSWDIKLIEPLEIATTDEMFKIKDN